MANPLLKYAKDKKTSQSDYQQTNQGAQNPERTDGSHTGNGNTNPLLKYANSVSSAPAAPAASSPVAADVSSPSTSPSSDSLSALKKQREDIYNTFDRRRAEMDRQYANDVYKQLTEIDGKIDRIENPGRDDAGEAYRKAKRIYEAELAYGDADTRAAAKKELEEKKADFSAAGGNPDATIVGSALKEYAGSLATGFGVLSATSGLVGMNPEELPADYEMQRALLDQARKNSSGQNDEINSIVERGHKLVEEGAMGVESAKAGRSAAGKFLVDLAVQATMMGGDMLLGLATGGGMVPLIARAYGGSVNEAIADGADYNMASLYGAAAAATEAFTERMFDGFAQVYGQGDSTKLVSYVSGKLAKTDAGRLAWQYIINGMGEGVEEVVSDLVNPLIKTIYNGKKLSQNYKDLNIGDIAYDFIVGAALGYSGVAVEAIGGTGMSDTAKFFSDAAGNGMSFKEACKLYEAMWTAYDEWVSRETDGKNAGYTDTQNAAGVNSGLFAEEDIVDGTGEYVDAEENATNNTPTANEADASGMTAEEYAKNLEQAMQPVQQEADIQAEQQSTPAVQQVEQENDISSAFDPFYNGDVINAGAVEEAVQNGTFPVEAIESIPVDEDIRNDKTTTNELIERGKREYAEKLAAQEAAQAQQEAPVSVQSESNTVTTPTQETSVTQQQEAVQDGTLFVGDSGIRYTKAQSDALSKISNDALITFAEGGIADQNRPYNRFGISEELADELRNAGLLQTETTEDGDTYETIKPEAMWDERGRRSAEERSRAAEQRKATAERASERENDPDVQRAIAAAESYGESGVPFSLLVGDDMGTKLDSVKILTPAERSAAYLRGKKRAKSKAQKQQGQRDAEANGNTGWRRGKVIGYGVKISDLKETFNDPQGLAYTILSTIAEVTGIDIILYRSEAENGEFTMYEGKFKKSTDQIYIDLNSGLIRSMDVDQLSKYVMLRTFGHELTHFDEKWSPVLYNEFRQAVFDHMRKNGTDVDALIREQQDNGMRYEAASREVVADAMTDVLPDSNFVEMLAKKHSDVFKHFLYKLKDFVAKVKEAFAKMVPNNKAAANAMKENVDGTLRYAQNIVDLFDRMTVDAVERYQRARATKETVATTEEAVEADAGGTKETRTPVSLNSLIAKAENYDDDQTGKQQLTKLMEDAYTRGQNRTPVTVDDLLAEVRDVVDTDTGKEQLAGLIAAAYLRGQSNAQNAAKRKETVNSELYKHFFEESTPEEAMDALKKVGFTRWKKNGKDRLYINADSLGLEITWGKRMGQVESASFQGEDISKSYASELRRAKTYVDVKTQEIIGTDEKLKEIATNLYMETLTKAYEDAVNRSANSQTVKTAAPAVETPMAEGKAPDAEVASPDAQTLKNSDQPEHRVAYRILTEYLRDGKQLTSKDLYAIADTEFGGTQAQGGYDRKDAYDAMELAVNRYLFEIMPSYNSGSVENAVDGLQRMEQVLSLLPTQSVRTEEQVEYQQFSTPPNIAYLAAWTANVQNGETVLEPSAGIGGLAVFPKAWGANVTVNELSERRLAIIKGMDFSAEYNENAEYIDDILPDEVKPTLVIMNPPFSSTAGRLKAHKTSNAEKHINSALARLSDGGRLVAILGKGMNDSDYSRYWNDLRQSYTIRANISIDGYNYRKYGTNYDVQLVVIDKIGSQGNAETFTGSYKDLAELPAILEVIRNERRTAEQPPDQSGIQVPSVPAESGRMENADSAVDLVRNRDAGIVPGRDGAYSGAVGESGVSSEYEADASPVSEADAGNAGDSRPRSDLQPGEAESAGEKSPESKKPGKSSTGGRGTPRNAGNERGTERAGSGAESARSGSVNSAENATGVSEERSDDGVYADYAVPTLPVTGAKKHPARLVESAAMSAVSMPPATYTPALPKEVVENNLSDAQMVSVVYAGQAHSQVLPSGERKGFFIGDGTGVGKGRQISGIILDNILQGRKKAVWISKNASLFPDAQRDWVDTTGRSKDEVHDFSKIKLQDSISFGDGILFSTYDTLRVEKGEHSRLKQIADWLGKDFDGVIAFDEAHNMGNLLGKQGSRGKTKGSEKARAAVELQKMLPNARVVYVSATAATEVEGLAFASRLGLWGTGTPFYDVKEFVNQIGSAGLSAMELVVRDMKALGVYDARSISYNGVAYDTVLHNLDETQRYIYDEMSRAWQNVMRNVEQYLKSTGAYNNSQARSTAIGQFYSSMQRFYNQVLTSMSMPSVIADMKKELAAGRSCVLQIVNTNQAEADRQIASIKAENGSLDDMDLTPRSALIGYLESCFPVYKFEEYLDDNGNIRSRQVLDSQGQPVIDKAAVRKRDALIAEINEMSIPDGPLEMLFNAFGTDKVAEVTGRSRRVVPKLMDDGSVTRVEESRTKNSTEADVTAFQDGKKRILVFSDAGGTGKSYHASLTAKNQQQRVHYVLQPGWIASNAVQGFGRTHRSNEASAPIYKLVTTDIKGQKRFTSTIARRLDQLGALTKGQRNTGSGMFGANDNLETDLAKDSLREFYRRLGTGSIEGVDGESVLQKLGLLSTFTDEFGRFKLDENVARDVSKFLNRILALEVDEQNEVFDAFTSIYETELENAIAAGTLDTGMENVKADKVDIVDDKVINTQKGTGAETHYIQAKVYTRPKIIRTVAEASEIRQAGFVGFYKTKSGDVRSVYRMPDKTDIYGRINKQYRLYSPTGKYSTWKESTLESSAEQIAKKDWQREWDAEIKKAPEFNEETVHMLTGALLPVWNKLPSDGITKVKRILADDGTAYLGRIIGADKIDGVLSLFSASRTHEAYTGEIISQRVLDGKRISLTNGRAEFFRSRVSGEWRIEYTQSNSFMIPRIYPEMIMERINYQNRYFVPVSEKGKALIDKIIANNPVSREANASDDEEGDEQYSRRSSSMTDRDILEMAADMVDESNYTDGEKDALRIFKERLTTLQELTEQREDMGKTYRAQQFGKPADRKGAEQTLARMKILDGRIEKARNAVLDVESKPVLRDVLSKSRNILEQQGKAATKAALNKLRAKTAESAGVKKYRKRIADDVADITNWITNPSNKSSLDRVPDAIKNPVIDFLNALDFTSKRALKGGAATKADEVVMARAKRLSEAMKKGFDLNEAYARYELPDDFFDRMDDFIRAAEAYATAGEFTINEMTAQELKVLSGLVKNLKKFIRQVNRFHQNAIFEHVSEASQSSMEFMRKLGEAKRVGNLDNFLLWQNLRPAYGFERFGRGGEAIWDELRRGQDKLAFNTVEISDFVKQTYTPEQVKEWSETVEVFEIGNEKEPVRIPVAYLMGLYELSKDPDGARHILEGGIRVAPFTVGENRVTNNGVDMTQLSLSEMVDRLKKKYPEAAETADKMQRFMARTGGKMANEVSMARFGEEMFTNEKYYPISSDGRLFDVSADKPYDNQNLYALLNMSFTKNRIEGANNRVVIYNIFDVFSNHMSGVATYNALALPVLDTLKWLNYRETVINETGDVVKGERLTEVMDRTFGGGNDEAPGSNARGYATKFVLDIVRSYNGTTPQSSPIDRFAINALHHYNVAQVAFNGRVVIQQPLAIVRAGMYLNIGDITGAIASFRKGKAYYTEKRNEMLRNSGIAAWKDLGFYDVNISRGLTELIKQDDSKVDKLNDFGLKAAEAADSVTWTAIWVASEKAAERKGFAPDSERYMEEVVRIFEEVIYKTQVVDSVLTKTAWLRDKGAVARATGSFMNEPVTTYNLLEDAYDKFNMDKRRGMSNQQAWQKNGKRIARIALIYGLTALTNAMITSIADAWRDDDDYQTALEKWWEAFRGNIVDELIPFNKLPLVSEAYDLILMTLNKMGLDVAGYEPNSFLFQWSDDWLKAVEIISDKMKGEDTNYKWYAGIYYLLRAASGMTGVPLGSITREVSDIWNNSVGALAPSLKLITYDPGVKNNIKYALWDGYLTEAEAADELVKAGIMNEADAREQARHWAYTNSNPDSTLTLTQLSNYDKYASPAGITIEEYENFLLSIKDYKGDTKKERIVAKINAMPVSARQKDAYFYAAGYKSSTLEQTPWHFDMSGWQIDDYKEYGAPAGIPKETFKTFTETASKIKGDDKNGDGKTDSGSKKAKVIAYIDGLSLTPAQKDALYYQQGYAESKIGDTPWH